MYMNVKQKRKQNGRRVKPAHSTDWKMKRNTLLGMRIQMYFKAYAKKAGIPIPAALEEQLKNAS